MDFQETMLLQRLTEGALQNKKRAVFIYTIFTPPKVRSFFTDCLHALSATVMSKCKADVMSSLKKLWDEVQMGRLFHFISKHIEHLSRASEITFKKKRIKYFIQE